MKMLKFVLDVGVGNHVNRLLVGLGYDTLLISSLDPSMADVEILAIAERDFRMVVTMDKDFGELVFKSRRPHNGVLLLRLEDATGSEKAAIMKFLVEKFEAKMAGNFCVFQNGRLRIRG